MEFTIKQGDTFSPLDVTVYDPAGSPLVIPEGTTVRFLMAKKPGGKPLVAGTGLVLNGNLGVVRYSWQTGDTEVAGGFMAEFQLTLPDGRILTVPNDDYIIVKIIPQVGS